MNTIIRIIDGKDMRYPTVGDYQEKDGIQYITVADMANEDYNFLVALHEFVESYLCKKRGIKEEDISKFDIEFEKNRKEDDNSEPGDDPNAPYKKEHFFATNIERQMALELGVDWNEYDKTVCELEVGPEEDNKEYKVRYKRESEIHNESNFIADIN